MGKIWLQEHSDALRRLVADGKSYSIIADLLNQAFGTDYSRNAAIGRAQRLGLCQASFARKPTYRATERKAPEPKKPKLPPAPPPRPDAETVKLRCAAVNPCHTRLVDLEPHQCRYPYGEGQSITFCGHAALGGKSYCEPHLQLSTRAPHALQGQSKSAAVIASMRRRNIPGVLAVNPEVEVVGE
jgi:GcrA cell cycle regulator